MPLVVELAAIPGKDKQLNGSVQGMNATRKAARFTHQAGKIVTEFSVYAFHPIGFALVRHGRMDTRRID